MPVKQPADTTVLRWIVDNYRVVVVCVTFLVGAVIAWANVNNRVEVNCAHIGRVQASMTVEMTEVKAALATQDTKLDTINTSVTRLLVIREREDMQH